MEEWGRKTLRELEHEQYFGPTVSEISHIVRCASTLGLSHQPSHVRNVAREPDHIIVPVLYHLILPYLNFVPNPFRDISKTNLEDWCNATPLLLT